MAAKMCESCRDCRGEEQKKGRKLTEPELYIFFLNCTCNTLRKENNA